MATRRHPKQSPSSKGGQFAGNAHPDAISPSEPLGLVSIRKVENGVDDHHLENAEQNWAFMLQKGEKAKAATRDYLEALSEARDSGDKENRPPSELLRLHGRVLSRLHEEAYRAFFNMAVTTNDTSHCDSRLNRDTLHYLRSMIPWADVPSPEEGLHATKKEWAGVSEQFAALEDELSAPAA